jgi:integrase
VFKSTNKYTKKEAKHIEAMERQRMMNEASMSPQEKAAKMLLSEGIKQVYEHKWKKNNKRHIETHRQALRLLSFIGDVPLGKIDDYAVRDLIMKLERNELTGSTINRYLAGLKTILRFNRQPWQHIVLRKERKGRIRVLSKDEENMAVNLLRNTTHNKRRAFYPEVAFLVEILVDTGMRLSELLDLRYQDIDFNSNLLSIWINKGDRPRSLPMTKRVASILKMRQKNNPDKPFQLTPYQADKAWAWVRKEMGLQDDKDFILHALRHTCASRLVNKGVDLYVVKEWLGHSSIQITERYAHLDPQKLANAATLLEPELDQEH